MAERAIIPIVLLTGFLGSGKTTLLSRWLRAPQFSGAMAIVNELGEVGLDHALLESANDAPLLLENGCACCAASDDLIATLERLFWDRLHKRIARFDWVLIETTGIADPGPIVEMLRMHQLLSERFRVAGVVTAFDALRGAERVREFPECRRQLEFATVVIITKADLVGGAQIEAVRDIVDRSAPGATVLTSRGGNLSAERLLAALGENIEPGTKSGLCDEGHKSCGDDHDSHAHHRQDVSTAFLDLPEPVAWRSLLDVLPDFLEVSKAWLLRVKGSVMLAETGGYFAVQAMPGEAISRRPMPVGPGQLKYRTGFTIISHGRPASEIAQELGLCIARASTNAAHQDAGGAGA
ncbi:MAG: hypothetical protein RLZ98_2933 [Pseudomonadota bacterium]|jgi:G3E family GTPase